MKNYTNNTIHELKLSTEFYSDVETKIKTFEIRKNDRNFKINDVLLLKEWDGVKYTGRFIERKICYITDFCQKENYVVLGIQ